METYSGLIYKKIVEFIMYSLCPIKNETFFLFGLSIKKETFPNMETTSSLLFPGSYFTLSSITHKTTLHKIYI